MFFTLVIDLQLVIFYYCIQVLPIKFFFLRSNETLRAKIIFPIQFLFIRSTATSFWKRKQELLLQNLQFFIFLNKILILVADNLKFKFIPELVISQIFFNKILILKADNLIFKFILEFVVPSFFSIKILILKPDNLEFKFIPEFIVGFFFH